jgi:hypothetical protein
MSEIEASLPLVTVAVLSWNRLAYLRATLESARACIRYPRLEWWVVDNESEEPGLRDYLEGCGWLDRVVRCRQSHGDAMNQVVAECGGRYLLLWPEDVQFVARGAWLEGLVRLLDARPLVGSVVLDAQRRSTLERELRPPLRERLARLRADVRRYGRAARRSRRLRCGEVEVVTCGAARPGICGSGIPSLTRTEIWRSLGPWKTSSGPSALMDSSLGAEDDMVMRFGRTGWPLQSAFLVKPVAADILTDPTGCKAKVRRGRRYGVYFPPPVPPYYYELLDWNILPPARDELPLSFAEIVKPRGFLYARDAQGERLKSAINTEVEFDCSRFGQGDPGWHDVPGSMRADP